MILLVPRDVGMFVEIDAGEEENNGNPRNERKQLDFAAGTK